MPLIVMASPAESGRAIHFCNKSDGVLLESKRLETITNCINEWIVTTKKPERTLSNHAKQAVIQIGQKIHDARLGVSQFHSLYDYCLRKLPTLTNNHAVIHFICFWWSGIVSSSSWPKLSRFCTPSFPLDRSSQWSKVFFALLWTNGKMCMETTASHNGVFWFNQTPACNDQSCARIRVFYAYCDIIAHLLSISNLLWRHTVGWTAQFLG